METKTWGVWFVTYGTYSDPDVPPRCVVPHQMMTEAAAVAERLGFGYCAKPMA